MTTAAADSTLRSQGFKMETPASEECTAAAGCLICRYFKLAKGHTLTGYYDDDFNREGTMEAFQLNFDITNRRLAEVIYVNRSTHFEELRHTLTSKYGKAVLDEDNRTATWKRSGEVLELSEHADTTSPVARVEFHNICLANHMLSISMGRSTRSVLSQGRSCVCCTDSK